MKLSITLILISLNFLCFSQSDVTKQINLLMSQIRSGSTITVDRSKIISSTNSKEISQQISKFFNDSVASIRYEALNINTQVALNSKDKLSIKKSIHENISNCIINGSINNQIIGLLKKYKQVDFSIEELQQLKEILQTQESNIGNLGKIYAFAGKEAVLSDLNALLAKPNLSKTDKKDIKLALVRSGDERLTNKMLEILKQQVINDDLIYSALPDILYTKNKDLYTHLLNAILSDSKKCSSANNDDNAPIICAYRLIEQLAPQIMNFPVTINTKGEIDSKDLKKTLIEVREWIVKNKNSFEIDKNSY